MKQVFLSYTKTDKAFAERLAIDLSKAGLKIWLDVWDVKVGDSIIEEVGKALSEYDFFVLVLSPDSIKSDWVRKELNASLMRNLADRRIKFLPILYRKCKVPTIIADLKYADFTREYVIGLNGLMKGLEVLSPIPPYSASPKSVLELLNSEKRDEFQKLFPYSFAEFPDLLFSNGTFDISVIVGSTEREKETETEIFGQSIVDIDLFGTKWNFSRQVSPGTVRDSVRVSDLLAYLGYEFGRNGGKSRGFPFAKGDAVCHLDISVPKEALERNLIIVGGADTNIYVAIAGLAFRQKFGFSLPIRYLGDDQLYFTCDQIYSEPSDKQYSRIEDSSYMHCGYVLMVANPWSAGKVIIFAVGTRATGTQAALLSLLRGRDLTTDTQLKKEPWHSLTYNNRFDQNIPGKIVRARKAKIIAGKNCIASSKELTIVDQSRISQRHIITEFEFLE